MVVAVMEVTAVVVLGGRDGGYGGGRDGGYGGGGY